MVEWTIALSSVRPSLGVMEPQPVTCSEIRPAFGREFPVVKSPVTSL
jgi:hypothetical protein